MLGYNESCNMKVTFNKLSDDTTEQWSQNPFIEVPKELLSFFQIIILLTIMNS